jgi:hypothetical protein
LTKTEYQPQKIKISKKKKIFTLISICCALAILSAAFAFSKQSNNQLDVKISNFSISKQWEYLGGLMFDCSFNLTIENKGVNNVTDLELKVKAFKNNSEVQVGNYFNGTYENGTIIEPLGAGEVREFKGTILTVVGSEAYHLNLSSNDTSVVAIVLLNNTLLDERQSQ